VATGWGRRTRDDGRARDNFFPPSGREIGGPRLTVFTRAAHRVVRKTCTHPEEYWPKMAHLLGEDENVPHSGVRVRVGVNTPSVLMQSDSGLPAPARVQ
jgi:hypothetical protein